MARVYDLLKTAVKEGASDLHITVGIPPTFKVGPSFKKVGDPLTREDATKLIQELFPRKDFYEEFQRVGDKDFSISVPGLSRFRVNAFMQRGSPAAVVRIVPFSLPDPDGLGIPKTVQELSNLTKGLVLVTGPASSGKSTTLASIIDLINEKRECHILTLEDPVEYLHKHKKSIVNQREIGVDAQSYERALRAAVREAPDVILLGEMRDLETTAIALTAAETGQLVLSTMHTIGAAKTVDRVIDIFPPEQQHQVRIQLSTVLQAVVSQQLIPSCDGHYIPAFEIMRANDAIRNLIRENKTPLIDAVIQTSAVDGMVTMDSSLAKLYQEGLITKDTALLYAVNGQSLERQLI
ncbi:MAG TPA: type IV pilus twitching motility protein PilT [Bacillota bacterium]|nr:type IV pilus twitching motility protein PilT [Candidatus Fermentithermobacillaceae bacterium]HOB30789.1 type IV pilus twitching motility protein PilT [Bacillota bacterium]HOK64922.1 type IV pilus twitching motility protein PilT [Bacillota bacterium]HOL12519.1 type IV pilus twitching motility protein PilT [Bacillota bacterium]HOQ03567.1 type IV pilus twitching motility protein PilT [Bacillota bacterium]